MSQSHGAPTRDHTGGFHVNPGFVQTPSRFPVDGGAMQHLQQPIQCAPQPLHQAQHGGLGGAIPSQPVVANQPQHIMYSMQSMQQTLPQPQGQQMYPQAMAVPGQMPLYNPNPSVVQTQQVPFGVPNMQFPVQGVYQGYGNTGQVDPFAGNYNQAFLQPNYQLQQNHMSYPNPNPRLAVVEEQRTKKKKKDKKKKQDSSSEDELQGDGSGSEKVKKKATSKSKNNPEKSGFRKSTKASSRHKKPDVIQNLKELKPHFHAAEKLDSSEKIFKIISKYVKNGVNNPDSVKIHQIVEFPAKSGSTFKSSRMLLFWKTSPGSVRHLMRQADGQIAFYDRTARALAVQPKNISAPLRQTILLCTVNLDKSLKSPEGYKYWQKKHTPGGYNSVLGIGRLVPDRSENEQFDGMVIPSGKTINQEPFKGSKLIYNEYIVHEARRVKPRYAVDVEVFPDEDCDDSDNSTDTDNESSE